MMATRMFVATALTTLLTLGMCQDTCVCGEECVMEGGGIGTCGSDYNTCAHFLVAVVCPQLQAPTDLLLGDLCASGPVTASDLVLGECPDCTECLPAPGQSGMPGSLLVHTCQVPDAPTELPALEVGDVCKSGGVETGPGVNRIYHCPVGSTCLPTDMMAIGGEVNYTCQEAATVIPVDGSCTLSGSLSGPGLPCEAGLECVITNPGRPEVDLPNAGICLASSTVLGFGAACTRSSQSVACAPSLTCVWTDTAFPSSTGYTCQRAGEVPDVWQRCDNYTNATGTSSTEQGRIPESDGAFSMPVSRAFYALVVASILLASHGVS